MALITTVKAVNTHQIKLEGVQVEVEVEVANRDLDQEVDLDHHQIDTDTHLRHHQEKTNNALGQIHRQDDTKKS